MIPTGCAPTPHPTATTAGGRPPRPDWPRVVAAGGDRGRPSQTLGARRRAGRAPPPTLPNRGACSPAARCMAPVDTQTVPQSGRQGGRWRKEKKKKKEPRRRARARPKRLPCGTCAHVASRRRHAQSHARAPPPLQSLPERGGPALQAWVLRGCAQSAAAAARRVRRGRRRRAAPTATTRTACTSRAGIIRDAPPRSPCPPPALDTLTPPTPFPSARCGGGGGGGTPAAAAHPPLPARPPRDRSPRTAVRSAGRRAGRPPARPRCRHGRRRRRAARPVRRTRLLLPPPPPSIPPLSPLFSTCGFPPVFICACVLCVPLSLQSLRRPPLTRV